MASLRAWLIFSNVNNHRADDEISWFAAVHRWSLSQMATASTWTSTTSSPSSQISEYTRGNLKRKAWSKHLNQRSFQKTPLCRPCAWSPRCLSSWARCRHRARIPGTQLPVAGTPHPVNWKVKTEETELLPNERMCEVLPLLRCSSHERRKSSHHGRSHRG